MTGIPSDKMVIFFSRSGLQVLRDEGHVVHASYSINGNVSRSARIKGYPTLSSGEEAIITVRVLDCKSSGENGSNPSVENKNYWPGLKIPYDVQKLREVLRDCIIE